MKRIVCLLVTLLLLSATLCSCLKTSEKEEDTTLESLPDYAGKTESDYDAEGDFILTSTENRKVFLNNSVGTETGYLVFTFLGEAVTNIQSVIVLESEEKAQNYVAEQVKKATDAGEAPATITANGKKVITVIGFSTDPNSLGHYYTKSKTEIISEFGQER